MGTPQQISSEERIFSLLLALAATQSGATKSELLSTVHGYSKRYADPAQRANVERQFERDKDSLRELGVPIETLDSPDAPGNNQLTRYRIQRELLQLPEDVSFSTRELSLLRLASFAWRESTLATDALRASLKLSSFGEQLDTQMLGFAPRITANEPSFGSLQEAQSQRTVVEFDYRKASDSQSDRRRVAPLALEKIDNRWHLIAWDYDRKDPRVFLLSRITSSVRSTKDSFDEELLNEVESSVSHLHELRKRQRAIVQVVPGSEAETRLGAPDEGEHSLTLHYLDEDVLAEELVEFGADVFVLEPDSLRQQVIALLKVIHTKHTGEASA